LRVGEAVVKVLPLFFKDGTSVFALSILHCLLKERLPINVLEISRRVGKEVTFRIPVLYLQLCKERVVVVPHTLSVGAVA